MKTTIFLILIGTLTISCNQSSSRVETDLYKCMMDAMTVEEQKKTNIILKGFEKHLVENGILESTESISYWKFFQDISDSGNYDFTNSYEFTKKIKFLDREDPEGNDIVFDCSNQIFQTEKYRTSRLFEYTKEMESLKKHKITPVIMARTTIKYLKKEDFELDYYRFITLGFIEKYK
jgi:hypothetical protein